MRGAINIAIVLRGSLLGLCLVVAACSWLPGAGPSKSDIDDAGKSQATRFALIDLNASVVSSMEKWPTASLQGTFGQQEPVRVQTIGVGDHIQITLWEITSGGGLFSAPPVIGSGASTGARSVIIPEQVVGAEDGSITVPYTGSEDRLSSNRLRVVGMTPRQVEAMIVGRLQGKAAEPQAIVTITKNISNTVSVLGDVTQGARVPLSPRGDRILDVISEAGGTKAPTQDIFLTLLRGGKSLKVPMQALIADPKENIYVRPGDVITAAREPQTFTAVGATGKNEVLSFEAVGLSLEQAIGRAGGLNDQRADPGGVFVIRFEPAVAYAQLGYELPAPNQMGDVPVIYRLNLRDPNGFFFARRFPMHNKDILFVSNAPAAEVSKVGTIVSTFLLPAGTVVAVGAIAKQ